ncbi:MAG: hypothetical protein WAM44_22125, partial [Chthoniobacterales bacterium]
RKEGGYDVPIVELDLRGWEHVDLMTITIYQVQAELHLRDTGRKCGDHARGGIRIQPVVSVEKEHHVTLASTEPSIKSGTLPAVALLQYRDHALPIALDDFPRMISRGIVHDDNFGIRIALRGRAIDAAGDEPTVVVVRDDDGRPRCIHCLRPDS